MAIEFDDLEQEGVASEVDEAEEDRGSDQEEFTGLGQYLHPKLDVDETGTLGDFTINTDIGVVLGVTATAVASKATLVTSQGSPPKPSTSRTPSRFGLSSRPGVDARHATDPVTPRACLLPAHAVAPHPMRAYGCPRPCVRQHLRIRRSTHHLSLHFPIPMSQISPFWTWKASLLRIVLEHPTRHNTLDLNQRSASSPHRIQPASHPRASHPSSSKQTAATAPV
ncbi:hypothetical protein JVU11DRAFT_8081 [Chiua virens]|nr:hypothetical protein JVU11DRAFT_8081 [Chiua virens]